MKRASVLISSFILSFTVMLSANCATVLKGNKQRIPVNSSLVGATITVNGVEQGTTPLELILARKKGQVIRIESPGHNTVEIRTKRRLAGLSLFGNFAAAGGLGFLSAASGFGPGRSTVSVDKWAKNAVLIYGVFMLVDLISGSGYELKPTWLNVTLTKADGTPRVDTILIDADGFRNVKWIRIHRD